MLESGMVESGTGCIKLPEVPADAVVALLYWIYLERLPDELLHSSEAIWRLMRLADQFQEPYLLRLCVDVLQSGLCAENAVSYLRAADQYRCEQLSRAQWRHF